MSTTLLSHNMRRARKTHACAECLRNVEPGEHYIEQRLTDGHTAWTYKAHAACWPAACSWVIYQDDDWYPLAEMADGHLPPCPLAWRNHAEAPTPPPCECRPT